MEPRSPALQTVCCIANRFFTDWSTREAHKWNAIPPPKKYILLISGPALQKLYTVSIMTIIFLILPVKKSMENISVLWHEYYIISLILSTSLQKLKCLFSAPSQKKIWCQRLCLMTFCFQQLVTMNYKLLTKEHICFAMGEYNRASEHFLNHRKKNKSYALVSLTQWRWVWVNSGS